MKKTRITKRQAIDAYGSQRELAKALGISEAAVSKWKSRAIPEKQALKLRYQLKPELFGGGK